MTQADLPVLLCGAYVVQGRTSVTAGRKPRSTRRGFGRLRQFRSGRWYAAYTGPDGNLYRSPETFALKMDAEAWLADRRREIDRDLWNPQSGQDERPDAPFSEYSDSWLAHRKIKDRTREHYRKLLDKYILPTFGQTTVRTITPAAVRRWYATLAPGAPVIRAHAYSLLRAILETARTDELVDTNPCMIAKAGSEARRIKIVPATLPELTAIVDRMPDKLKLMTLLAAWCALRFGETIELRRRDVDTTRQVVTIRRGAVRTGDGFKVTTPKSAEGDREVHIPPHLMPAVVAHLAKHTGPGPDALLFPNRTGGHLQPSSLYTHYYPARAAAGRPDLRWHDLRHTGAVLAAATGATLAELMERLGHATPTAAMRYQHAAKGRARKIAEALSQLAADTSGPA